MQLSSAQPISGADDWNTQSDPIVRKADDWNVKYAPISVARMIGSATPSDMLLEWLRSSIKTTGKQQKRSALITGPPGCGKTLLARLACREVGVLNPLELNCASKRTKKTIEEIDSAFQSRSLSASTSSPLTETTVIIVDEIDECDQGGLAQLVKTIRTSRVPVICIAEDGYNRDLASSSLVASSLCIRMQRPTADQLASHLLWICREEESTSFSSRKMPSIGALRALSVASNCDVRQAIIELRLSCRGGNFILARNEDGLVCDHSLGAFDVLGKLFPASSSLSTKTTTKRLGFGAVERMHHMDKTMVPLLIAENYVRSAAFSPLSSSSTTIVEKAKRFDLLVDVADSISMGDVVEGLMLKAGAWELQDELAHFATVRPVMLISSSSSDDSHIIGRPEFPSMLARGAALRKASMRMADLSHRLYGVDRTTVACELYPAFRVKYVDFYGKLCRKMPKKTEVAAAIVAKEMNAYGLDYDDWTHLSTSSLRTKEEELCVNAKKALEKAFSSSFTGKRSREEEEEEEDEEPSRPKKKKKQAKKKKK
jgi:hypothetical protein